MPEGDTIFRTAETLRRWIDGRQVTGAEARVGGVPLATVIGTTVTNVEARAKHLLIRFSNGAVLHTHMRMTGSWHVYPAGERWRRPGWQARVVLECGDRVAVCFNAPVIELLRAGGEHAHPALRDLGPDVLDPGFDLDEVVRRAAGPGSGTLIGEVLLDQRIVSGIGNIYRCESLFVAGVDPWRPVGEVTEERLRRAVTAAADLMRANTSVGATGRRETGGGPGRPWVYQRAGRPCRRCGTLIRGGRLGAQARSVYWCPACQPN